MNKKKLLLISPRSESKWFHGFRFFPPLSLGIIAALTPQNWEIEIIDENIDENIEELTIKDFDLVGISCNTHNINRAYYIADILKKKSAKVILGGAHVTAMPDEAINYADAVVIGDSEPVWTSIINDFETGNLKRTYKSISNPNSFIEPELKYYDKDYLAYPLETSKGCHNNCSFCGIHIPFHKPYMRKPIDMIIKELKKTKNPFVFIVDNNFYGNDDSYMHSLFDEIKKNRIKKIFFAAISIGFFRNERLVARAAECGLKMVFVGFESDTKQSLQELNKKNYETAENIFDEYKSVVKLSHKYRILIAAQVMLGIENDTKDLINKRSDFFTKLNLDLLSFGILSPLPNSFFFKKFQNEGRLFYTNFPNDWSKYDYWVNTFRHNKMSKEEIEEINRKLNFFNGPSKKYILRSLFKSRSFNTFLMFIAYTYYLFDYRNIFFYKILRICVKQRGLVLPK